MDKEELTPHIEELKRVLGDRIDEEMIVREIDKYLNEYHVGMAAAKRGIIRKYGGEDTSFVTASSVSKKIGDLTGSEQNVDITAKVVYVENKDITVKGLSKTIISGILGDETATASFTMWEPGETVLEKGSVYRFRNCYCKLWNEKVQINLGNRARVEEASEKMDVPERSIDLTVHECKIGDIREGMGNVSVTGKVLTYEERDIKVRGEPKVVYSGLIADDTGKIQYSAWKDFGIREGETLRVENAYIRAWKGIPQLNMGERCEVSRVDSDFEPVGAESVRKTVDEIARTGGGLDITVEGIVVDMKAGSGLIKRCPECNSSILDGQCKQHGKVVGRSDLRLKLVVDDGTGAIGAFVNRSDTEKLTGVTLAAAEGLASVQGEGVVAREMASKVLMKRVAFRGNVMSDDYGPSMVVKSVETVETDLEGEAAKLLDEVEEAI